MCLGRGGLEGTVHFIEGRYTSYIKVWGQKLPWVVALHPARLRYQWSSIFSSSRGVPGLQVLLTAGTDIVSRRRVRAREWNGKNITPEIR